MGYKRRNSAQAGRQNFHQFYKGVKQGKVVARGAASRGNRKKNKAVGFKRLQTLKPLKKWKKENDYSRRETLPML